MRTYSSNWYVAGVLKKSGTPTTVLGILASNFGDSESHELVVPAGDTVVYSPDLMQFNWKLTQTTMYTVMIPRDTDRNMLTTNENNILIGVMDKYRTTETGCSKMNVVTMAIGDTTHTSFYYPLSLSFFYGTPGMYLWTVRVVNGQVAFGEELVIGSG